MSHSERLLEASIVGLFITLPLTDTLTVNVGFPITVAHAFAGVVAVLLLWVERFRWRVLTWLPATLFAAFCAVYAVSFLLNLGVELPQLAWATGRNAPGIRSTTKVLWLLGNVLIALVIANAVRRTESDKRAIRALGVGAVISAAYALYQVIGESHGLYVPLFPGTEFVPGTASYWIVLRAKSTFLEPSFLGAYLAAAIPFVAIGWTDRLAKARRRAVLAFVLLAVVLGGILVTFSIAGWLSTAAGLAVLLFCVAKQGFGAITARLAAATAVAVVVVFLLVPGVPHAIDALIDKGVIASGALIPPSNSAASPTPTPDNLEPPEAAERSAEERVATTLAAIAMFRANPLVGVGPGNFGLRYPEFRPPGTAEPDQLLIANDIYAEILAESGILGFFTFIAAFIGLLMLAVRAYWYEEGRRKLEISAGIAAIVAMGTAFLTGPSFTILYQWAMIGLVCALITRSSRQSDVR